MGRNFMEMLCARWAEGKFVCVGLDTDPTKVPADAVLWPKRESTDPMPPAMRMIKFNQAIIEATKDAVLCYKPNLAFYLAYGSRGIEALERTVFFIKTLAPDVPIILDFKVGDIGNTNLGYVRFAFDVLDADAVTVSPYVGQKAIQPFLDRKDKGIFVLCRTSNVGADEFQGLGVVLDNPLEARYLRDKGCSVARAVLADGSKRGMAKLYQHVAHEAMYNWNYNSNCGLVVGATAPAELAQVRQIVCDMPILIPGIGAQGGDLEATIKAGRDSQGGGMIINLSRSVLYASNGPDFAEAARAEVEKTNAAIRRILQGETK